MNMFRYVGDTPRVEALGQLWVRGVPMPVTSWQAAKLEHSASFERVEMTPGELIKPAPAPAPEPVPEPVEEQDAAPSDEAPILEELDPTLTVRGE